jgi:hypothetical protein
MTKKDKSEQREFRLLLAALFPVFFTVTLVSRLLPWNWGRDKRSIFSAARSSAYNAIPFAFM